MCIQKDISVTFSQGPEVNFKYKKLNLEKTNDKFVEKQKKACRSVLKENRDLVENFDKTMQKIKKYLDVNVREHGQKGLAIFASNEHDLFIAYKLGVPVEDLIVLDASPYIKLAWDIMKKHKKGGMLQARFQRLR